MNLQQAQSSYTPAGGMPPSGTPPVLGQQNPVTANELPAQGGLSVLGNPMAQQLQSMGRGEDTMLVHMTPGEVNSLQGLAMATGGSLTINPQTGLPEAGWLSKLLPTILGAIATPLTGGLINPLTASAIIGAGTGIAKGSLTKGLMAGLQAYGGAALGSAAGLNAGSFGIGKAASTATSALPSTAATATKDAVSLGSGMGPAGLKVPAFAPGASGTGLTSAVNAAPAAAKAPGFFGRFADAARAGLPAGTPGIIAKNAPTLAGLGVFSGASGAMTPSGIKTSSGQIDNSYQGPYTAQRRTPTFAADTSEILGSSKERNYFDVDMPEIYNMQGQVVQPGSETAAGTPILRSYLLPTPKKKAGTPMYGFRSDPYMQGEGFAKGGVVQMDDGGFVVDARTVAEAGNGFTEAGENRYAQLGGIPLRGPGDGVSDSIPARIGRDQPARVAAGEVYMPPQAVARIGGGNPQRGAQKLYAMMERAHKATKPGQQRDILKGLA